MASGIDYDQLDEQDRRLLQQNETRSQEPPSTGYTNLYVFNPLPPLQLSQPEPYIEDFSAACPAYVASSVDHSINEAVKDAESVPRTEATKIALEPRKPTKKRKQTSQPLNKQSASFGLGKDNIVDFTTTTTRKKHKTSASEQHHKTTRLSSAMSSRMPTIRTSS